MSQKLKLRETIIFEWTDPDFAKATRLTLMQNVTKYT